MKNIFFLPEEVNSGPYSKECDYFWLIQVWHSEDMTELLTAFCGAKCKTVESSDINHLWHDIIRCCWWKVTASVSPFHNTIIDYQLVKRWVRLLWMHKIPLSFESNILKWKSPFWSSNNDTQTWKSCNLFFFLWMWITKSYVIFWIDLLMWLFILRFCLSVCRDYPIIRFNKKVRSWKV